MTSSTSRLTGNTLHSASIAEEAICVIVDELESWFVENSTSVCLGNGKTDGIRKALSKWTGRDLNAISIVRLGMTGCDAVDMLRNELGTSSFG